MAQQTTTVLTQLEANPTIVQAEMTAVRLTLEALA